MTNIFLLESVSSGSFDHISSSNEILCLEDMLNLCGKNLNLHDLSICLISYT